MGVSSSSLEERILSAAVARRFYLDGLAKSDIAKEFGVSRFRVARLIEKALQEGIVRIEFAHPADDVDYELSSALKTRLELRNAIVVGDSGNDPVPILDNMGQVAAQLLRDIAEPNQVIGFASTRAMEAMDRHQRPFAARAIVQLGGAWPGAVNGRTSVEIVHRLAQLTGSPARTFYAPLLASDIEAVGALRRQADFRRAEAMYSEVDIAVVGLGALQDGQSSLWPALSLAEREEALRRGAIGEICGMTFDAMGKPIETVLASRCIGITLDQLCRCPEVLCLAFGKEKAPAILAAIRSKIVKSLVTHAAVARAMLEALDRER